MMQQFPDEATQWFGPTPFNLYACTQARYAQTPKGAMCPHCRMTIEVFDEGVITTGYMLFPKPNPPLAQRLAWHLHCYEKHVGDLGVATLL
jgi:hypothetical protein